MIIVNQHKYTKIDEVESLRYLERSVNEHFNQDKCKIGPPAISSRNSF